jgi:hypothetical protein
MTLGCCEVRSELFHRNERDASSWSLRRMLLVALRFLCFPESMVGSVLHLAL